MAAGEGARATGGGDRAGVAGDRDFSNSARPAAGHHRSMHGGRMASMDMASRCARCGARALGKAGHRWCVCGWSEDAHAGDGAVEEPKALRRRDLHANVGRAWTPNEIVYLERHRNRMSLKALAHQLGRSPHAVEQKLHKLGWRKVRHSNNTPRSSGTPGSRWGTAEVLNLLGGSVSSSQRTRQALRRKLQREGEPGWRGLDGMMSESEVSREYGCPVYRVRALRLGGVLTAEWRWGSWRFDPYQCEEVAALLLAPKQTWKTSEPDTRNYEQRYGLRRERDPGTGRPGARVPRVGG